MRAKPILIVAGVALLLGGLWYYRHNSAQAAAGGGAAGGHRGPGGGNFPVPVVAGVVEKKDVPIYLDGLGTVQAFNTVTVKARVDGTLDKVVFSEGQDVKQGDLLAQIDVRPYQASYDQAVAKKAEDEAMLASARLILARDADLIKTKVLDQQTYDTQRYTVDQLVATVQGDQAAIDSAKTQVDYTRITAPIDGRVGIRQVDQGNIIHATDTSGLVVITQLHPVSVVFTLPEQNLQLIRDQAPDTGGGSDPKMTVIALDRDNAGQLGTGALAVIDNQIDQTTGTIKLKATFQNQDLRLWPGEFVNARLLLTTRKGGITVPASVIQRGPQGSYAFVIKPDHTVETAPVKVAQIEDGVALVDQGLSAGEQVVVDGQYKLQEGSKVIPSGGGNAPGGAPGAGKGHSHGAGKGRPSASPAS
jgi:multidrug efflux system membrane fusion protein